MCSGKFTHILLVAHFVGICVGTTQKDVKCPCLGTNYQVDDDNDGKIATLTNGPYDATYGESCQAHTEYVSACTGASPAAWCSSPWCYVDPCFCEGPTDIGESDYFSTPTDKGKRLFYSYAACGSKDEYNAAKCPALAQSACTAADECTWDGSACGVATAKVATARAAAGCSALIFGSFGSQCRCIGNNKQERVDDNGVAVVMADKASLTSKKYAADYGDSCKIHKEPGQADCQGDTPASWCASTWCYVDPCKCGGPTDFGLSDYFSTTADNSKLYYSYAACGSADVYSVAKCTAITDETACNAEDECAYSGGACAVDAARLLPPRTASGCGSLTGSTSCTCLGSNGQTAVDGKIITDKVGFSGHKYAPDYGNQCTPHAEPGASACSGNYPASWCKDAWCYVDPCNCNDPNVGLSDYFSTTSNGKPLYYSYATCNSADGYNSAKCTAITASATCTANDECTWASGACSVSENRLTAAKTNYGCTAPAPTPTPTPTPVPATPAASGCPSVTGATTMKIGDLEQGSEFTKCIKVTDFNSKSLGDDIEVVDRDAATGCCPACWIPGIQWYNKYWGSMIVCGFKDDGSVNMATSSSNGAKTCTYNKCYVVKMDITCADSSKMKLDGCCPKDQWTADCKMYSKSQSFFNEKVGYCLSYAKKYKVEGTNEKTDDQAGGKLALSNIAAYTGCAPFGSTVAGGSGSTGGSSGSSGSASGCPSVTGATTMKIGDLQQGSEFTKCIKVTDFNSKSLGDEIQVVDRDAATGCCPACWIPGIKWYNSYWGSMIVCGFKGDGSVNMATSSSNGAKTCTYNKCYVVKMDITCADNSKMKLDGCCPKDQWTADCLMYSKSQSFFNEKVGYCLSYAKKYKVEGTNEKADDQAGGKLALSNVAAYTGCAGFSPGAIATTPSPSNQESSPAMHASLAVFGLVGAAVNILM